MSTCLDKFFLKKFEMELSKKEFLHVLQDLKLSKTQSSTTAKDRKRMKVIPYALAIGSIEYAMLCTRSIVYPTLILAREYNSDLGVDHWTTVKIILSEIRICFSIMEVTKRFIIKGYVDASFDTNLDDF